MKNFLVVDDDIRHLQFIRNIIKSNNDNVYIGLDGEDALNLVKIIKFDLIFLDLVMPNIDGESALLEIKKTHPDIKIVLMSSAKLFDESLFKLQILSFKEKGADGFLIKPFTNEQILKKIKDLTS
jgi:CheY-like chemotaxis protein